MRKKIFISRICAATLSMFSLSAFAQDCMINFTNFDTDVELCNPALDNSFDGWYSDSIRNGVCSQRETTVDHAIQGGIFSAKITTYGNIDFETYANSSNMTSEYGYVGLVANPRMLSPFLMETDSKNLIVAAGNFDKQPFMRYTVKNLVPGSSVMLTCDAYSLLSIEEMENYLITLNENATTKLVTSLSLGGMRFDMQTMGEKLWPGSGRIFGNRATLAVGLNSNPMYEKGLGINTFDNFGERKTITYKGIADDRGEVSFYFSLGTGATAPIGIDNIKIEGQIQPTISCNKRMPVCPAFPVTFNVNDAIDVLEYNWKSGNTTSTNPNFTTIFEGIGTNTIECTIKSQDGCSATATIEVPTKECCKTIGGMTLDEKTIFFDDFGEFTTDGNEYTYTDANGTKHTIPVTNRLWGAHPFVTVLQEGASTPDFSPAKLGLDDGWMITNVNPYTPGVANSADNNPNGGMFIMDMKDPGLAGKVIYRRKVENDFAGKEINIGCKLGAINNKNPQAELAVNVKDDEDNVLFSDTVILTGNLNWVLVEQKFVSPSNNLIFEIVNVPYDYQDREGDIAIDDIFMTCCYLPEYEEDTISSNKIHCYSKDGLPVSETYLYYDDFGKFSDDGKLYTFTNENGKAYTQPVTAHIYGNIKDPFVTILSDGTAMPDFNAAESPIGMLNDHFAVTCTNPYASSIKKDASDDEFGGMLLVDIANEGFDKILYKKYISGISPNLEYRCGFSIGTFSISNKPNIVRAYVRDAVTNEIIDSTANISLYGTEGWMKYEIEFVSPNKDVIFEIVNKTESSGDSRGDYAIDNFYVSYCAMPEIDLETSTTMAEALELCQDDTLNLVVLMSKSAEKEFGDGIMYTFQYTTSEPTNGHDKTVEWQNITTPSPESTITLNKNNLQLFENHDQLYYFRAIAGTAEGLEEFMSNGTISQVSISFIPVVAMSIDCSLTGIESYTASVANVVKTEYYNLAGQKLNSNVKGLVIERQTLEDGNVIFRKVNKE